MVIGSQWSSKHSSWQLRDSGFWNSSSYTYAEHVPVSLALTIVSFLPSFLWFKQHAYSSVNFYCFGEVSAPSPPSKCSRLSSTVSVSPSSVSSCLPRSDFPLLYFYVQRPRVCPHWIVSIL